MKTLNVESVQNNIFESFLRIKMYRKDDQVFIFSKDQLIEHLTKLDSINFDNPDRKSLHKEFIFTLSFESFFEFILISRRNIDLELAQSLADIIIERAKRKEKVILINDKSLSDTYQYTGTKPLR